MRAMIQTVPLPSCDLSLLAYAQHMTRTARSDAARRLFASYLKRELQRLQASVDKQRAKSDPKGERERE